MHRQHGAHQGSGRAVVREAARSAGRRPDSAADARHDRRPADAGQDARRGDHGRHRSRARPARAQRRHDVAAGSGRSPRRRDRRGRVLHGDAAGRPHRPWYMLDNAENCLRFLAEAQPIPRVEALAQAGDHCAHGRHRAAVADASRCADRARAHCSAGSGDGGAADARAAQARAAAPRRRRSRSIARSIRNSSSCSSRKRRTRSPSSSGCSRCGTRIRRTRIRWSTCAARSTR